MIYLYRLTYPIFFLSLLGPKAVVVGGIPTTTRSHWALGTGPPVLTDWPGGPSEKGRQGPLG